MQLRLSGSSLNFSAPFWFVRARAWQPLLSNRPYKPNSRAAKRVFVPVCNKPVCCPAQCCCSSNSTWRVSCQSVAIGSSLHHLTLAAADKVSPLQSFVLSLILFLIDLSVIELWSHELRSTEWFTILGGFLCSLLFLFTFIVSFATISEFAVRSLSIPCVLSVSECSRIFPLLFLD